MSHHETAASEATHKYTWDINLWPPHVEFPYQVTPEFQLIATTSHKPQGNSFVFVKARAFGFDSCSTTMMTIITGSCAPRNPWLYLHYLRCETRDPRLTGHTFRFNWYWLQLGVQIRSEMSLIAVVVLQPHWNNTKKRVCCYFHKWLPFLCSDFHVWKEKKITYLIVWHTENAGLTVSQWTQVLTKAKEWWSDGAQPQRAFFIIESCIHFNAPPPLTPPPPRLVLFKCQTLHKKLRDDVFPKPNFIKK